MNNTPHNAQQLSHQPPSKTLRPLLLRFPTFIRNFIKHLFAIIILQRMNTPVRSAIWTNIAVTLYVFSVDQKIASWTPAIFTLPTPQDEDVEQNIKNRDNRRHNQPHQIDRREHAINTFFYDSLLKSRLKSLTKEIPSNNAYFENKKT